MMQLFGIKSQEDVEKCDCPVDQLKQAVSELPETQNEIEKYTPSVEITNIEELENGEKLATSTTGFVTGQTFVASDKAHKDLVTLLQDKCGNEIEGGSDDKKNVENMIMSKICGGMEIFESKYENTHNAAKDTLSNLMALKEFLDQGYDKVFSIGYECSDDEVKSQLESVKDIHKKVLEELERQVKILKNLLKVTLEPTSKSLSELILKHKDYMKVMDLLADFDYGTKEASDRLALVFNGVSQVGLMKEKINKALKSLDMSEKDYKNTKNLSELRKQLFEHLKKLSSSKIEQEKVNDIFSAMKVLEQNLAFSDKLGGKVSFKKMMEGAAKDMGKSYKRGGVPSRSVVKSKNSLTKRIQNKQKTNKEIMKSFIKDVNLRFNAMKDSIDDVSEKVGSSVPYDNKLKEFIMAFSRLGELNKQNIYFALINYDDSSASNKQMRVQFLDDLDFILKTLEPLTSGVMGSYFKNIKQNIISLIEVIDTYTFVLKGLKESKVAMGGKPSCTKKRDIKEYENMTANSVNLIKGTVNKLNFYGKVATIRSNLSCISKEHTKYQEGYDKILGKAIGEEKSRINKEYKEKYDLLESLGASDDKYLSIKNDKDSRTALYNTIEAVDLYLMNFSDAIAKNPQAVNELEKMLQSTQIIAQWFVEKSGDNFKELLLSEDGLMKEYENYEEIYDSCKASFESISVLKNIISMFIHIGEKFGSIKLQDKIHMSSSTIYKNLVKYVWISAVNKYEPTMDNKPSLKSISVDSDDEYFQLCIKAVVSKILTVVGTYSIFQTPEKNENMITNPVRLILGGNDEVPEVKNEAIELYIRLPLLVEFYKVVFDDGNQEFKNNSSPSDDSDIIAFIPEMGSLWSGLIKIIFDKSRFISKQDLYSLQNMKDIVREINKIYTHYSSANKGNVVREAFCGLISEINRRYGILKKCDINQYYQAQKKYQKTYYENNAELTTNFDILNESDERNTSGPSEAWTVEQFESSGSSTSSLQTDDLKLIKEFRQKISDNLKESDFSQVAKYSFDDRIRFYKEELKSASTNEKKFDLVVKAIEQSNDTSKDSSNEYILFHELVVAPCNTLNAVNNLCSKFSEQLLSVMPDSVMTDDEQAFDLLNVMELLYTFCGDLDGLVSLKFITKNKVAIIYDKLQTKVETMIDNIKYMISKFRNVVSADLIAQFEDSENKQSIYFLENVLLKHFLRNELKESLSDEEKEQYSSATLDSFVPKLNKLFERASKVPDSQLFGKVMWNTSSNTPQQSFTGPAADAFKTYDPKTRQWSPLADSETEATLMKAGKMFSSSSMASDSGLVALFNGFLSEYLSEFYDISTRKIYGSLFSHTAENTFSSIVYGKGIPNVVASDVGNEFILSGNSFPENNVVLTASVAYTMNKMISQTLNPQLDNKYHMLSQLSDVSPHMVEVYRTKLPVFIKLFKLLSNKCLLYKQILENDIMAEDSVDTDNFDVAELNLIDESGNKINILSGFKVGSFSKDERMTDYRQVLSNVINGCMSIVKDAQNVLSEVKSMDGKPELFFELKNDFIKDYYTMTKSIPFMPASTLLVSIRPGSIVDFKSDINTDGFKYLFGTRATLNGDGNGLKHMPYMTELFSNYNATSRSSGQLDSKNLESSIDCLVSFTRFVNDIQSYKNMLSSVSLTNNNDVDYKKSFAEEMPLSKIIDITQNTFTSSNKESLYNYVKNMVVANGGMDLVGDILSSSQKERKYARLLNIIDMNVVPINIHSLMKEVPLVNIYNYSISYDDMINKDINSLNVDVSLFKELLLNPYTSLEGKNLSNVFNGRLESLHLFKPRFISDQLVDKIGIDKNASIRDTKIVRDTIWFVNIQRMLRRKIRNELSEIKSKVVENNKITSKQLTDYVGEHDSFNEDEFNFVF